MVIVHSFLYVYQRVYGMDWYDGYDMDFKVVYDESCFKATVEGAVRSVFSFFSWNTPVDFNHHQLGYVAS